MPPVAGSNRCFAHSPERAAERAKARRRGGRRTVVRNLFALSKDPLPLRDVPAIQALLEKTVHETRAQRNSSHRSRAIGALLMIALKALETGSLEDRIAALEERLTQRPLRSA
jgi:hypothetical protein